MTTNIKIKVINKGNDDAPNLLSFPQDIHESIDIDESLVTVGEKGTGKKRKRIVMADLNGTTFRGVDFGDLYSVKNDTCKYAIGILDEKTNEMNIVASDHVFVMKPHIKSKNNGPVRLSSMTSNERRESLTEEFGSKKKKRALAAKLSNSILSENVSGVDALENVMSIKYDNDNTSSVLDAAEEALELNRKSFLPTFNINAINLSDAYPIFNLIPKSLSISLDEYYDSILNDTSNNGEIIENKSNTTVWETLLIRQTAGESILSMIRCVDGYKNSSKAMNLLKTTVGHILMLHYSIRFYLELSAKYNLTVSKNDIEDSLVAPKEVIFYLSENYARFRKIGGKNSLISTKTYLDKLLLYCIVLGLTINDYTLNLSTLSHDLKITPVVLANLAKELGCKISKANTDTVCELTLPLTFPERRRPKQKGGNSY